MVEKTKQFIDEVNELKKWVLTEVIEDDDMFIDERVTVLYSRMFKMLNTSMEIMVEQAKLLEDTNEKVTKLLSTAKAES